MDQFLTRIIELSTWPGRIVGWLGLLLIVLVCMTVAMAQLGWDNLAQDDPHGEKRVRSQTTELTQVEHGE